jgi:hypothetical protein
VVITMIIKSIILILTAITVSRLSLQEGINLNQRLRCGDTVLYNGQRAKVPMIGFNQNGGDVVGVEVESAEKEMMVVISPTDPKIKVLDNGNER